MNVTRPPANNIAVRRAVAYLMPRQSIAGRVYHGQVKPLYSMVPAGYPGHIDAFASLYGRSPNPAKAKAVLEAAGLTTPLPIEIWWTPTHYGDASADEYAEIKRGLERNGVFSVTLKSTEWAQYSERARHAVQRLPARLVPGLSGLRELPRAVLPVRHASPPTATTARRWRTLIKKELASKTLAQRIRVIKQIQLLAAKDVPIIPYWQQSMIAVGRNNVRGIPSHARPDASSCGSGSCRSRR